MLIVIVQVGRTPPARWALPVGAVVAVAVVLSPCRIAGWPDRSSPAAEVAACCSWAVLTVSAVAVGVYLRFLDETRVRAVAVARHEQRAQLASDLHDWLAHEVTGIVLEAQAAQVADSHTGETGAALKRIEESGVRALEAMDDAIQFLRRFGDRADTRLPGRMHRIAALPDVIRRFATAGQVQVSLDMEEGVEDLGSEIASIVHRVVVESLTNVRRHAPSATLVRIRVAWDRGNVVVAVHDDGDVRSMPSAFGRGESSGVGLQGLAEHVDALGGTFTAGRAPECRGWSVRAVLPVEA